jgi:hypothetical protein
MEVTKMKVTMLISLIMVMLIVSLTANALSPNDKACLLYLPCNAITGGIVADSSPSKNNGTVVGTVSIAAGKFGQALSFTEAGEVKCGYVPLNNKSFTICMWINPKQAGGAEQCIFSQIDANATNTSMHFRMYTANGTARMGFYSNDLDALNVLKANTWVHLAFYVDVAGKVRRIYADGKQVGQDAGLAGVEYLGKKGDTMIGSWGTSGQKFNGLIDEVQIWDKALTAAEITESMGNMTTSVSRADKLATTWGEIK